MSSRARFALIFLAAAGCADAEKPKADVDQASPSRSNSTDANTQPRESAPASRDEGNATLLIGDDEVPWNAPKTKAVFGPNDRLWITADIFSRHDGMPQHAKMKLFVSDVDGPGEYVLEGPGSTLEGIVLRIVLTGAKVQLTELTEDFVDGTITWSGVSLGEATKLSGSFHARIEKG